MGFKYKVRVRRLSGPLSPSIPFTIDSNLADCRGEQVQPVRSQAVTQIAKNEQHRDLHHSWFRVSSKSLLLSLFLSFIPAFFSN
jgi:hypothetical protein